MRAAILHAANQPLTVEDVEVDASIVEQLRDPLTHLVRNAVDHGIENEDARRRAGKSPVGRIAISARALRSRHPSRLLNVPLRQGARGAERS